MWDFLHACSHLYVYFDIALDLISLWCPFLWELLGSSEVFGMLFLNTILLEKQTKHCVFYMSDSHSIFIKTHSGVKKKRILCALNFLPLIKNSFISPSSLCSMLAHDTQHKKKKKKKNCGSRQGKVLRNFHSFFFVESKFFIHHYDVVVWRERERDTVTFHEQWNLYIFNAK